MHALQASRLLFGLLSMECPEMLFWLRLFGEHPAIRSRYSLVRRHSCYTDMSEKYLLGEDLSKRHRRDEKVVLACYRLYVMHDDA